MSMPGLTQSTRGLTSLNVPDDKAMVISSLTLQQYHDICDWDLSLTRTVLVSTDLTVNLGAVFGCYSGDQLEASAEIASLPDGAVGWDDWYGAEGKVINNGWIRYFIFFVRKTIYPNHIHSSFNSGDVVNKILSVAMFCRGLGRPWLSQANQIFRHLQITSNFEKYCTFLTHH
jgi:hypothetical protein